jgi:hypothetical protein
MKILPPLIRFDATSVDTDGIPRTTPYPAIFAVGGNRTASVQIVLRERNTGTVSVAVYKIQRSLDGVTFVDFPSPVLLIGSDATPALPIVGFPFIGIVCTTADTGATTSLNDITVVVDS